MKRFLTVVILFSSIIFIVLASSLLYRIYYHKPSENKTAAKDTSRRNEQISIMNGTSVTGLASKAGIFFRNKAFDVVEVGNYKERVTRSFIIDRVNDKTTAARVAEITGINKSVIVTDIDSSMFLKCTLVIGEDYKKLKPFINE